ncbi:hypothetical protein NPIL_24841 [Nephila pilipes]|uniref:Uncharacterized protein n=1 Tax=Nephila pilipes TaxID=299642 RepID=A0A8X6P0G9_NEPPI|nr:hypothetical protein NPIL_24841 [Nephila pilipes]
MTVLPFTFDKPGLNDLVVFVEFRYVLKISFNFTDRFSLTYLLMDSVSSLENYSLILVICKKARKSSNRTQPANQDAKAVVPGKKRVRDLGQDSLGRRFLVGPLSNTLRPYFFRLLFSGNVDVLFWSPPTLVNSGVTSWLVNELSLARKYAWKCVNCRWKIDQFVRKNMSGILIRLTGI